MSKWHPFTHGIPAHNLAAPILAPLSFSLYVLRSYIVKIYYELAGGDSSYETLLHALCL